jgi:hypothetical protein
MAVRNVLRVVLRAARNPSCHHANTTVVAAMKTTLIICALVLIVWFVTNAILVMYLLWRSRQPKSKHT